MSCHSVVCDSTHSPSISRRAFWYGVVETFMEVSEFIFMSP
jgi:hypothetical protein